MAANEKDNSKKGRRSFLRNTLLFASGSAVAGTLLKTGVIAGEEEESEKVKMLTADGKLVEVDRSKIPLNDNKRPVSNATIKAWLKPNQ